MRRPSFRGLAAVALTLAAPSVSPAAADRITEVTVYLDRAEITREARVSLPAGPSTVRFSALPIGVEADSLRVRAEGVAATLGAVEMIEAASEPAESPELAAARTEVERLEAALADETEQRGVDDRLQSFLQALQATTSERASRELGEGGTDAEAIGAVYDLLASRYGALATRRLARSARAKELNERLQVAKAQLETLRPRPGIRSREAEVEIEAHDAGSLVVRLSYVVPGAHWRPSYRATLDPTSGDVSLVSEGVVRQATGEDWSAVGLVLSTAAPARGVEPPMLEPWILRPAPAGYLEGDLPVAGRFYQNVLTLTPEPAEEAAVEAQVSSASLQRSAYTVAFGVPGLSDVPADGRDHRVPLRSEGLKGKPVYRVIPGLDPRAYLTSVTTTPLGYPLLAGTVRVLAGGAYLGTFVLEEHGPGVELTLPFGVDNRIEVVRVEEPQSAGRDGLGGSKREVSRAYRTEVRNLRDVPVTVVLEERVPVSEDTRIVVELDERRTSDGFVDSPRRAGVKIWTFELGAGEKREIAMAYAVRFPRDVVLPGF